MTLPDADSDAVTGDTSLEEATLELPYAGGDPALLETDLEVVSADDLAEELEW